MTRRYPVFEPEAQPIESTGDDLPPVPSESLTPEWLRARFGQQRQWAPEPVEARWFPDEALRVAAVLIPLVVREFGLTVLFTQRADYLNDHAGQVSFPGGRREPTDASIEATALREAHEEVALALEKVEVLGTLPAYITGTGFHVMPVVGLVHPPFSMQASSLEVADIFEVPLAFLMNPAHHQRRVAQWQGQQRRFFAIPYPRAGGQDGDQYFIWGATAGMVRNFYHFLSA